jgi:hypothetical protein
MKQYKTRTSVFHIDNHGIIHKTVIEGVNVSPEDVAEDQEMLQKLSGGKRAYVVVKANAFHTMTPEAINALKEAMGKSRFATAMISRRLGVRIFVDTVSTLTGNNPPFEMFPTESAAVKWILGIMKDNRKNKKLAFNVSRAPKTPVYKATCDLSVDNHGILTKRILDGAHIDLAAARQTEMEALKLVGKKKVLSIVDRSAKYTITKPAIRYLQSMEKNRHYIATALISNKTWPTKSGTTSVRVFKDKTSAVKWLLSLKKK